MLNRTCSLVFVLSLLFSCQPTAPSATEGVEGVKQSASESPDTAPLPEGAPSELAGRFVPPGVDFVAAVDLRNLKGTILERQFRGWVRYAEEMKEFQSVQGEFGVGAILDHALIGGGTFKADAPFGVEFAVGLFGLKNTAKLANQLSMAKAFDVNFPGYETGHEEDVATWMAGPGLASQVKELLKGAGKSINDDESWVALQKRINTAAPLWAMVKIPELDRAQYPILYSEVPGLRFFPGAVEFLGMTHAAFSVDVGDRLEVRAAFKLQSAEDAQVVLEQMQMATDATLWEPTLFFERFELSADGDTVTFAAAISKKAWRVVVFWSSVAAQVVAFEEMRRW